VGGGPIKDVPSEDKYSTRALCTAYVILLLQYQDMNDKKSSQSAKPLVLLAMGCYFPVGKYKCTVSPKREELLLSIVK
jgi:hypothetical protein